MLIQQDEILLPQRTPSHTAEEPLSPQSSVFTRTIGILPMFAWRASARVREPGIHARQLGGAALSCIAVGRGRAPRTPERAVRAPRRTWLTIIPDDFDEPPSERRCPGSSPGAVSSGWLSDKHGILLPRQADACPQPASWRAFCDSTFSSVLNQQDEILLPHGKEKRLGTPVHGIVPCSLPARSSLPTQPFHRRRTRADSPDTEASSQGASANVAHHHP